MVERTIGVKAEISHGLHVAMVEERIRRRYGVKMQQLVVEALEHYLLEELPRRRSLVSAAE